MKTYDEVVYNLGTTQAEMMLAPKTTMQFYIAPATVAYLYDKDVELVEMDIQLAYKMAFNQLTKQLA
jgi:hypothetical protein